MIVKGKSGPVNVELTYFEDDKYYRAEALDEKGQVLGYVTFGKHHYSPSGMWLFRIETLGSAQRNKGIGDALLSVAEYTTVLTRKNMLEGNFNPQNHPDENGQIDEKMDVRHFYEKRGFSIYKEDYDTLVGKTYMSKEDRDAVLEGIGSRITGYDVRHIEKENQM